MKLLKITFIRAKRAFTLLELHRIQSCDPITVMKDFPAEFFEEFQREVKELHAAFEKESVRGTILVLTARIDDLLMHLIKRFIKTEREEGADSQLFKGFGPLGTFRSRTEIAYRLGLISKSDADHYAGT